MNLLNTLKNNSYSYFVAKTIVLLCIIALLDYGIGSVLRHYYFTQQSGLQYRTTYSIDSTTAKTLVFGSSRANHHYYPHEFETQLHQTYYNVGRDGSFIHYHYAVLQAVLKRYTPKIIILDITRNTFEYEPSHYDRLSALLPYYQSHPELRDIIILKSEYEQLKLQSSIYPYNSSLFTIAVGNTNFNKKRKEDIKGYVPLTKHWASSLTNDTTTAPYAMDSVKIKLYNAFIDDCAKAKIPLYIVCSPYFVHYNAPDYSITLAQQIAQQHNVPFFNYTNDTTFTQHPNLFADATHLNNHGALIFSKLLLQKLLPLK